MNINILSNVIKFWLSTYKCWQNESSGNSSNDDSSHKPGSLYLAWFLTTWRRWRTRRYWMNVWTYKKIHWMIISMHKKMRFKISNEMFSFGMYGKLSKKSQHFWLYMSLLTVILSVIYCFIDMCMYIIGIVSVKRFQQLIIIF